MSFICWSRALFTTNPIPLKELLDDVENGKIQLPDFQRGWVWDDERIKGLLVSISRGFPIGAIMTLSADGEIQFQKRPIEGVVLNGNTRLERYLLDGQQRLTSLYQALRYEGPVETRDRPGGNRVVKQWYYIDMQMALDPNRDPEDAFTSVPEDRIERGNFGRDIVTDLSSPEREFEKHMMPTEHLMANTAWGYNYAQYWNERPGEHPHGNAFEFFMKFQNVILDKFTEYQLPAINLDKDTSKEAVCAVFEKVNTGGVTLTVFELLTASLAADGFSLRDDWNKRRNRMDSAFGLLKGIEPTSFLQAVSLLATQERGRKAIPSRTRGHDVSGIGCKRGDILSLTLDEYRQWADKVETGFLSSAKFLHSQFVFTQNNVPYNTQLVPLAALYVELGHELDPANAKARLERWFWSGVFGEIYGSTTETQYARDLPEVAAYIRNGAEPTLITQANFAPSRLVSLRSRQSAAYKGLYALQMKSRAADWRTGEPLTLASWHNENIDIHHIFPKRWCQQDSTPPVPWWIYDSIVNKTPIDALTNRIIGGNAPSQYLRRLRRNNDNLRRVLKAHWLNPQLLESDQFAECFVQRAEAMLALISRAMGKSITGGRETIWDALHSAGVVPAREGAESGLGQVGAEGLDDEPEFDDLGDSAYITEQQAADD